MSNPLKVLQITDLHLRADSQAEMRGKNVRNRVDDVFAAAKRHRLWPADLLLLTGDIADEKEDHAFESVYSELAQRLTQFNTTVCAIPGNHDHAVLMRHCFSGLGIHTGRQLIKDNWKIVLVDSSVPGQVGGHLSDTILANQAIDKKEHAGEHLLIAVHHPLVNIGSRWLDRIRTDNGEQLLERLQSRAGVKLVLWGHSHQEYDRILKGVRLLGCPAACPVQFKAGSDDFAVDEQLTPGFRWCLLGQNGTIDTWVERI